MTDDNAYSQGLAAYKRDEYETALAYFEQAREAATVPLEVIHTHIGLCYQALEQWGEAIQAQLQAVAINPDYVDAWKNMGIACRLKGDFDRAEACYEKALAIEPQHAPTLASLGVVYIYRDKPAAAIRVLEQAIAISATDPVYFANIAQAYAMLDRFDEADAALKRSVRMGYANWEIIKGRIDNMKKLAENLGPDTTWLPAVCPRCGASTSAKRVLWTGPASADCGACGANLPR